jgi:hypothetical protein
MSETAASVLALARQRAEVRANAYVPADYPNANKVFKQQKAALTRALNSGDPAKVVLACRKAVQEWSRAPFNGAWPDDWSNWQRALDDTLGFGRSVELSDLR